MALLAVLALFPPETRGESMAGSALLVALLALLAGRRVRPTRRLWPLLLGLVAFFAIPLLALAPGAAVQPLATLCLAFAAGVYTAALPAHRRGGADDLLPLVLAAVAVLVALHGLQQSLWGLDSLARSVEEGTAVADPVATLARLRAGRAFAGFPTPAALGGFLVLALPSTAAAALAAAGWRRRALLAAAGVQGAALLAAASASAVAGLLVALLLGGLGRRRWRRRALLAATVASLALVAVVALRGSEIVDPNQPGSPWRSRAGNARIAVEMIADHPWVGVGPGGYGELYPGHLRAGDNESQHAHNLPLELVAEWGLPSGLVLTTLVFVLFVGPLVRAADDEPPWRTGLALGLAALALQNLVDFTLLLPSLLWLAAVLRGWIAAAPPAHPGPAPARGVLVPAAAAAVAAAAVVSGLCGLAWNDRQAARQALAAGDAASAIRLAQRSTRLAPWNPDGWLILSGASLAPASPPAPPRLAALRGFAERAVRLSPVRPAARMLRARLRVLDGDLPGGYADAEMAARLYPLRGEYARARDALRERFAAAPGGAEETR